MLPKKRIISWLAFRVYRLNLHFDLVLARRWKWRKYLTRNRLVLEVGPAGGPWTLELLRRNNRVTVVDVDMASLLRLKSKVAGFPLKSKAVRLVNSTAADFSSREKYDQIVLFEVLEHIADDCRALDNLVRHLAPGGEILISTPHRDHIPIAGEGVSPSEDGGHVRKGYDEEDFRRLLGDRGLQLTRLETACGWFTRSLTALANRVGRRTGSPWLFYLVRLIFRPLTRLDFLRPGYPPYTIFLTASRPSPPRP